MKKRNKIRSIGALLLLSIVLLVTSCTDGFIDKEIFSSSVRNSNLSSPDSIVFTPSTDGSTITVSWPIVTGAGGYKVTLYNVTSNTIVGTANQVVDEDTIQRPFDSESNYKAVVRTMDNAKLNNVAKGDSVVGYYGQTVYATIPDGTDLSSYFTSNPVPNSTSTVLYQLVPGGQYTMSGNVSFGLTPVKLRGDKTNHPKITMSNGYFVSDGAGINLVRVDLDCTNFPSSSSIVTLNPTQNSNAAKFAYKSTSTTAPTFGVYTTSTFSFVSCKITGLAGSLIYDGGSPYVVQTLGISDCIIGQTASSASTSKSLINVSKNGFVKDLTITNSTFYHSLASVSSGYLINYTSSMNVSKIMSIVSTTNASLNATAMWASQSTSITNSTFWQSYQASAIANCTGFAQTYTYLTLKNNIFVNSGNNKIVRTLLGGNTTAQANAKFANNTYWWSGAYSTSEVPGYDNSGTYLKTDPGFKNPTSDFTITGTDQINYQTGDPRWWPNSTVWK